MKKELKSKLKNKQIALGGWAMIGHPVGAEIMARAGFDWVCVDLEHSATDILTCENMIRAIQHGGSEALVRLTNNDPNLIKRVMDSGASGIILPLVKTAEDMQEAIDAMYYPPRGKRGVGLARAQLYGSGGFEAYRAWLDQGAVCIAQIEHISAVENLDQILSVDGVDGYFLGPYDLSASMGLAGQIEHPDVKAAMDRVLQVASARGVPGGMHIVEPNLEKLKSVIDQGFTFIAYSIDTRILDTVSRSAVAYVKEVA